MKIRVLVMIACVLLLSGAAFAQTGLVIKPTTVEFDPSPDHSAIDALDGAQVVASYRLDFYEVGGTVVVATADLGRPAPATDGKIRLSPPLLTTMPAGKKLEARVVAMGPGGEAASNVSNPFGRRAGPRAQPTPTVK